MRPEDIIRFVTEFGLIIEDINMSYDSEGNLTDFSVYMVEDDEDEIEIETYLSPLGFDKN